MAPRYRYHRREERTISARELEVYNWVSHGYSAEMVAGELSISIHTVRSHLANGRRKLGAKTRPHAVAICLRRGLFK